MLQSYDVEARENLFAPLLYHTATMCAWGMPVYTAAMSPGHHKAAQACLFSTRCTLLLLCGITGMLVRISVISLAV